MEHVRREDVKPQPPAKEYSAPEPYRVLFPIGVIAALAGLLPWVAYEVALRFGWPLASLERRQGASQGSHHAYPRGA